jgi:hypothetical protein
MTMKVSYAAKYYDKNGSEDVSIENDGKTLRMVIRDVTFACNDFESFEVEKGDENRNLFTFSPHGYLADYFLEWEMPIQTMASGKIAQARLLAKHHEGYKPSHIDMQPGIQLTLIHNRLRITSQTKGFVEDALFDINKQISSDDYLCICWTCAYSQYAPGGNGFFGGLACFRDNKQGLLSAKNKGDLFKIWHTRTEYVQETYLCPEYKKA